MTWRRWFLFPFFLIGLLLTNFKAILIFILHPLLKHRFFSFSLFILIIYLAIFGQALVKNKQTTTIKLTTNTQSENKISFLNFDKFKNLKNNLNELEKKTGGTTLIYLNLALISHYQGEDQSYQDYQLKSKNLDPNHPIFKTN
ncbi:hypothetical protein KJZ63_01755 [Patescibacteria group bacterium]|nr:hypothetical protein [Patescibacteria group bacterium]